MRGRIRPIVMHVVARCPTDGPAPAALVYLSRFGELGLRPVLVCGWPRSLPDTSNGGLASPKKLLSRSFDLPVLRLPGLSGDSGPITELQAVLRLAATIHRLGPTVIHSHSLRARRLVRLATRLTRLSISSRRSAEIGRRGQRVQRAVSLYGREIDEAQADRSDVTELVVVCSPASATRLKRFANVAVLPPALDWEALPDGTVAPAVYGKIVLQLLGEDPRGYDLLRFSEAVLRLSQQHSRLAEMLVIAVTGETRPELQAEIQRRLPPQISQQWRFNADPGELERGGVDGVVWTGSAPIVPSGLIRALARGLPVMASAVDPVAELLNCDWVRQAPGCWTTRRCTPRGLALPLGQVDTWSAALARFVVDRFTVPGAPAERQRFVRTVFDPGQQTRDLALLYGMSISRSEAVRARRGYKLKALRPATQPRAIT